MVAQGGIGVVLIALLATAAMVPVAGASPSKSASASVVPIAVAARWQPLRPRSGDPAYARAELKKVWRDHGKRRYKRACKASDKLLARLLDEGAALFYKPVRQGADLGGIAAFMDKHVRGRDPLLQVAHEVLVPSAAFRSLAVDACMRAGQPLVARRFIDQAAISGKDSRLRTAAAVVRLACGHTSAQVGWLLRGIDGGARAELVGAVGAPGAMRNRQVELARKRLRLSERQDVEAVIAWLKNGK